MDYALNLSVNTYFASAGNILRGSCHYLKPYYLRDALLAPC